MADPDPDSDPVLARAALIKLLEDDQWEFTDRALKEGRSTLRWLRNRDALELEIIDYIIERLKDDFPIELSALRDAWVMKNPDGRDTYIKLKIEVRVLVMSCHPSDHARK